MSKAFVALLAQRFSPLNFSTVPGFPHPVPHLTEWGDFLPILRERNEDNPAEHIIKFHECMDLLDLQHEDVGMKMFMHSLDGDARKWYFSLPPSSISSLKYFHRVFNEHCKRYFSDEFLFENCCEEYELNKWIEVIYREYLLPHNVHQLSNDLQDDMLSHENELEMNSEEVEGSLTIIKSDCYEYEELIPLTTHGDDKLYFGLMPIEISEGNCSSHEELDFHRSSIFKEEQQKESFSSHVPFVLNFDGKVDDEEEEGDVISNMFQNHIAYLYMHKSSSLPLGLYPNVPIFEKYSDDEEYFKVYEGLLTNGISSSSNF